ncbi:unnamed protein product [Agarophyton chilense]|eukprot:gb/GEZJ01001221.1/.p1 GENE.gb/GEZJ01001221.1/~~gb/GEZJ01001221.1/.p1  ORF type:complete len:559 (-),score=81.72 gb/GEZJ01001221.1/:1865-3541(-)
MQRAARLIPRLHTVLQPVPHRRFPNTRPIPRPTAATSAAAHPVSSPSVNAPHSPPPPIPDPSPAPSTSISLPVPGGDEHRPYRQSQHHALYTAWRALDLPPHARVHPADLISGSTAIFIGAGLETNWPAVLSALEADIFNRRKVVIVRDVFDRSEHRKTLSDYFAFVADDVVAVLRSVVKPSSTTRRFVNEFVWLDGAYKPVRTDVDLISYLHGSGFRVIPVDSTSQLARMRDGLDPIPVQQSTNHVLACAPTAFSFNQSAASDNHFMNGHPAQLDLHDQGAALRRKVLTEFSGLHSALIDRVNGVGAHVHLFTHEDWHNTPDACFPNNTFSTHTNIETGNSCVLVLYPMKADTRRKERRLVQRLLTRGRYTHIYDMTREEEADAPRFLEGTGSLVLDRINRVAYVALSQRSDAGLARAWAKVMDYDLVPFSSVDREGRPIYHTNVMMSVGTRVAVVCLESIADKKERDMVVASLKQTGHSIVDISHEQVEHFCGNVLELESFYADQVMVMSTAAHKAFTEEQKDILLSGLERLVHADISTIEKVGGGGVRCTIAELH